MSEPEQEVSDSPRPILEQLRDLEPLFHRVAPGTSRDAFAQMISDDFFEVGASGRRYDREFVLDTLEARHREPFVDTWVTRDFDVRELGADHYLLTYILVQGVRITRRATIWRRSGRTSSKPGWKAVYHQGTIVAPEPPAKIAPEHA